MSRKKLNGLYVITDDKLTPQASIYEQVELSLKGGAKIIQLRNKSNNIEQMKQTAIDLQNICHKHDALFILNDNVELAIELKCDGLHIGKSDHHRFKEIREKFDGVIGVSCYEDIELAKKFENSGADYVAFGSFFYSPTKPNSNIIPIDTLKIAKNRLNIPICAIGGINSSNIDDIIKYNPDMVSLISDIWTSHDIYEKSNFYTNKFKG